MTFAEKLDRAKTGSRAAYESLCLGSVDSLYTAALIALKSGSDAENAVKSAISDGYAGIARIKDERHLRSWLVHELTKHIVEKLKENKAGGRITTASGVFAPTERLPDVERLVFSVAACFGYGTRELSVLTGMSENAAAEKLGAAEEHLGSDRQAVVSAARNNYAPLFLKDRYGAFDESLARLEQEEKDADEQPRRTEPAPADAAHEEPPVSQKSQIQSDKDIQREEASRPDGTEHNSAVVSDRADENPEKAQEPQITQPGAQTEHTAINNDAPAAPEKSASAESATQEIVTEQEEPEESVFADENEELAAIPAGESAAEQFDEDDSDEKGDRPALNAETFIAVVSAEQMKGSEFLRLIGNTRISNNVYREIEQNPRLTKKRLIALLEQSPLNETDYYKLLTAVKHRREVINAKEESRLIHERAGLFDGNQRSHTKRRRVREVPKTALQMAIEVDLPKKEIPLTIDEKRILEDDYDYEIKTASAERRPRSREESFRDERIPIITSNQKSLGAVINEVERSREPDSRPEPFHPSDMEGIFNNIKDIEAVDPIAAIYARETGDQVKPKRIEEIRSEWIEDAKKQEEERVKEVDNSSGTQEFEVKPRRPEKTFDTREFDASEEFASAPADIPPENGRDASMTASNGDNGRKPFLEFSGDMRKKEPETVLSLSMDSASDMLDRDDIPTEQPIQDFMTGEQFSDLTGEDPEPEIETIPVSHSENMSVTQIISDYSGKTDGGHTGAAVPGVSDVTAILEDIPKHGESVRAEEPDISNEPQRDAGGAYRPDAAPEYSSGISVPETGSGEPSDGGYTPTVPAAIYETHELDIEAEDTEKTFVPPISDNDDDEPDDDDGVPEKRPSKKEKHRTGGDVGFEVDADDPDDAVYGKDYEGDSGYDADEGDLPRRERYKGNEYFPDDNEYYEGVNRGKTVFCIVCAALLVIGALSMKFVFNKKNDVRIDPDSGNTAVSDTAEPAVTEKPAEDLTEKSAVDDTQILTHLTEFEDSEPEISQLSSVYMRASGEPYAPFLSKNIIRTDDTLYIYNDGKLRAVSLSADEPKLLAETDVSPEVTTEEYVNEFIGFTLCNEKLYAVIQEKAHLPETGYGNVFVITYNKDLTKDGSYYSIYGQFCGMGISGGKLTAVTYMPNSGSHSETGKPGAYPFSSETELTDPTKIIKLNGSGSHGYAVIGEVGGTGLTAIAGCMAAYPKFDENGGNITLLAADKEQTFAVEINSSLEAVSAKRYAGRAFSEDCLNGDRFIGADMTGGKASGTVASVGKNALTTGVAGETPFAVAWTDDKKTACVLASQESGGVMLYGFDMSGETPASASDVSVDSVYSDKLISANGKLMGIKLEGSEESARAGFRLSAYDYDGKRKESAYTVITADDKSADKYMRSPAESDIAAIAVSDTGLIAFPMIYFDGFSEVERVTVFSSTLEQLGEVKLYDEKSSVLYAAFSGDKMFVVTDRHIITAELSDLSVQKTFDI